MAPVKIFVFLSVVAIYCIKVCHSTCPIYQVAHTVDGNTVCCKPVFDCRENHEVIYCSENGGRDECVPCETGHVNHYNTSSIDPIRRSCFLLSQDHSLSCPVEDTLPTVDSEYCEDMKCKCRFDKCYYGNPCMACRRKTLECGVNEEIDRWTGECQPCKKLMYSPRGCSSCVFNETAWILSQGNNQSGEVTYYVSTTPSPSHDVIEVTSKPETNKTDTGSKKDGNNSGSGDIVIPVVCILAVLVAIGLLVACCFYTKGKVKKGDKTSLHARIYIYVCHRNQKYKTDEETLESPPSENEEQIPQTTTSNNDDQKNTKTSTSNGNTGKPTATLTPMLKTDTEQVAEGGANDEACMDLLKTTEGGASGTDASGENNDPSSDNK